MPKQVYPFTAVVGQERVKMALILSAIDPKLGGILITGPKGSGKSTIIRAMENVLPQIEYVEDCPFNCNPKELSHLCSSCRERLSREGELPVAYRRMSVIEIPLSTTEDGLLGYIDAEAAFQKGIKLLQPGLLSRANQNILYIDEINLLSDHLLDCILDPAVSGWNVVQREGMSLTHPSRFTLIASMNPEEGGLRPQILDRFALKVEMESLKEPKQRVEVVRRNLSFEDDPSNFIEEYEGEQQSLIKRIQAAREVLPSIKVPDNVMEGIAEACSKLNVEGVRSDISILKGARALAALTGQNPVEPENALEVFDLALSHRIRKEGEDVSERAREELTRILHIKPSSEDVKKASKLEPLMNEMPEGFISSLTPPRDAVRRRRIPANMLPIITFLILLVLIIILSFVSSIATLLFEIMFLGLPVASISNAFTFQRVFIHFGVITSVFLVLNLFVRRMRRRVIYLYAYLGTKNYRWLVPQQEHAPPQDKIEEINRSRADLLNIPIYASLRTLYKTVIKKGAKLLDRRPKEERKHYKFSIERKADPMLKLVGRRSETKTISEHGRYVSHEFPKRRPWDLAFGPTIRAAAPFQRSRERGNLALKVAVEDVRVKVREMRTPITMVLLLDVSESMIASLANVRNAILSMRDIVFKKRGRLGLVIFKGESASTLQVPTTNIDLIVKKLSEVGASDLTPLASGMFEAWRLLRNEKAKNKDIIPVLVIISDGIANIPLESPLSQHARPLYVNTAQADVIDVAHLLRREGVRTLVINPSHSPDEETPLSRYKTGIMKKYGKIWFRPTELLLEIPRISGGYYYGIGEEGGLEEVILTQALSIFDRTHR